MRAEIARQVARQVARHLALNGCALMLLAWAALLHTTPAAAQPSAAAVPDTRDMIEALKPSRSRNLLVRQTPSATAPAASSAAAVPVALPAPALGPTSPASPAPSATATATAAATALATPSAGTTATTASLPSPSPSPSPSQSPSPSPAPSKPPALVLAPTPAAVSAPPRPVANPSTHGPAATEAPPSLSLAIQFELNSARVRPESGPVLGNLVAAMTSPDLKGHRFVIEGHTDARGNPAANQQLSQHRADEVRLYLVALGVHPARLRAVGKGSSDLANARDPLSADNRRVRVVTLE